MCSGSKENNHIIEPPTTASPWKYEIRYLNVLFIIYLHISAAYGAYLGLVSAKWSTIIFSILYQGMALTGITAGVHRLWSHKSYKATLPLQIILMICHSATFQPTIFWWVVTHRLHHKFSDTDADPHNASRGLFFSHIGWCIVKPHPEVAKRRHLIDVSDLYKNAVVCFQRRYSKFLSVFFSFLLPTFISVYFWSEAINTAWHIHVLRVILGYHTSFSLNSFSHTFGDKPYDKNIKAGQNSFLGFIAFGEGWHNFHHVFPWDYGSDEFGMKFSITTFVIDLFAKIGWSYDFKRVTEEMVVNQAKRGDGSASYVKYKS